MNLPNQRQELACEAARLMCEEGLRDFAQAKAKALDALGGGRAAMPTNLEVADCVREHLALFDEAGARQRLRQLREVARQAMLLCAEFSPRVAGATVDELAILGSPVQLHLFSPYAEAVDFFLGNRGIPFDIAEKRLRHPDGQERRQPSCVFMADEIPVELVVFDEDDVRWSPLSPVDGKPMRRWTLKELEAAVASSQSTLPQA